MILNYIPYVPYLIFILVIIGVVAHFSNRNQNTMDPNQKASAKDFFLNIGAIIALYTVIFSLLNLLFTIIDTAYPPGTSSYYYSSASNISWPVSILIIFFPILIILMWVLEKQFTIEPEKKNLPMRKWLSYITLFAAAAILAGDLVTILYSFLNGDELTAGFVLKIASVFVVSGCVFLYYLSDIRDRLTSTSRKVWRAVTTIVVIGSVIWGFSVIGSPWTQRGIKYDQQKVRDLQNLDYSIRNYYEKNTALPLKLLDLSNENIYYTEPTDKQLSKPYEYQKTSENTYQLCADFNIDSKYDRNTSIYPARPGSSLYSSSPWNHPAGHYCFSENLPAYQQVTTPFGTVRALPPSVIK